MKEIIRLKHWQVFGIIGIGYIISFALQMCDFELWGVTSLELTAIVTVITLILLFFWVLIVGLFLNNRTANVYSFRNWVFVFAVGCCAFGYTYLNLQRLKMENQLFPFWFGFITLFTLWGIGYTYYQVARSLKSQELGREAAFSECIIDAITLFAFPFGVWFVQPRINRILTAVEQMDKDGNATK